METCPDCHGAGRIPSRGWAREEHLQISSRLSVCPTCEGLGEFADWAEIPGAADGVPIDETTSDDRCRRSGLEKPWDSPTAHGGNNRKRNPARTT